MLDRYRGAFAFQANSSTRAFEYPWAFYAGDVHAGQRVLEIGGGLSGFQFALSRLGCSVINVDPGVGVHGQWGKCDTASIAALNRLCGTSVELRNTTIEEADLPSSSFDRVFCISVLEHLTEDEIAAALDYASRCLRVGGRLVLTVDLFLDLVPFTSRQRNVFGTNIDLEALVNRSRLVLQIGDTNELNGFPAFDPDRIQSNLSTYLRGIDYPALSQCLVLTKRDPAGHPFLDGG